jgi:hypothetical protein
MMEHTSHLAGPWIGNDISNTSHSNKAGSTTVKGARLKVGDQGRRQFATKRIKNIPIGLHVAHLYFPDTPRMYMYIYIYIFIYLYIDSHKASELDTSAASVKGHAQRSVYRTK